MSMTKVSSKNEKPAEAGSDVHESGDACQKYGNIWLCGNPVEVKQVIALLKEQQENTSESSPDDTEADCCKIFDDESGEEDQAEDD